MSIRFIYGRSGVGKSRFCISDIKRHVELGDRERLILLVPEQYMFSSENKVLETIGEKALLNTRVMSFNKMSLEFINKYGGRDRKLINETGKKMIIQKVLDNNINKLSYFKRISRKQGFNQVVSDVITEFKKYNIDVDKFSELDILNINPEDCDLDKSELQIKLEELAIIFREFEHELHKEYIDSDDKLTLLYNQLKECDELKDSEVWIDEFTTFTPQQLSIIEQLLKKCKRVNITLTSDQRFLQENSQNIFITTNNTEAKVLKLVKDMRIAYDKPIDLNSEVTPFRFINSPELEHLERHFYSYPYKIYKNRVNNISLYKANNPYDEINNIATDILRKVRDENFRFRDISVVCRNIDDYEKIISVIFDEFDIPYFLDKKLNLVGNPLIVVIMSSFEILLKGWSYESVFKYLKSGLIDIDRYDIDRLENYILEKGIKGKRWTLEDLKDDRDYNIENEDIVSIYNTMEKVREPLIKFHNEIRGSHRVRDICSSLYSFLREIYVFEKINQWIDMFNRENMQSKVREYEQVEKIVIDTLDQAVNVMGDDELKVEEFFKIIDSGFKNEEIGIIPATLDQVNIGDIARIKGREVKVLYIVGLNDGVFPLVNKEEGIITDSDREVLKQSGISLSATTREKTFEEEFLIYTSLSIASDKLILSYPIADFEGKSLRPSIIVLKLKKIFSKLYEDSFINKENKDNKLEDIVAPIPTFNDLILAIRKKNNNEEIDDCWKEIYKWFSSSDLYEEKLNSVLRGLTYSNVKGEHVNSNKLKNLYLNNEGKLMTSISKLERYAGCPFSYFIMYGLKAKNRKVYEFTPPDLGSFVHEILDDFVKYIKKKEIVWSTLDIKNCEKIVGEIVDEKLKNENMSILSSSSKYKYLTKRFKKVISRSAATISRQIEHGNFEVFKTELSFSGDKNGEAVMLDLDSKEKVYIQGRIDRIDTCDIDDSTYVRIVDYKTGNKQFDLNEVYYGLQMQLLMYLDMVIKNSKYIIDKQVKPGAILYFKVDDPMIKSDKSLTTEEIEKKILENLKLKGLLIDDIKVVKSMDKDLEMGYSLIIPAGLKKDGDFTSSSSVLSEENFDVLRSYVNIKMKEICKEMLYGDIRIAPIKNGSVNQCEYCDYSSICQFDLKIKDNKYNILGKGSDKEVISKMKKKIKNEEEGEE